MEIIQNSKLLNAIKEMSRPIFLFLNVLSILVLLTHSITVPLINDLLPDLFHYFPTIIAVIYALEVFDHKEYIAYSFMLSIIKPNYLYSYLIIAFLYLLEHLDQDLKRHTYMPRFPLFVEDSMKDLLIALIVGISLIILNRIPSITIHIALMDSLVFIGVIVFMHTLLFYEGIHPRIIAFFLFPIEIFFLYENIMNFYLGKPLVHLLTHGSMSALCSLSGTGITIGIALLHRKLPENSLTSAFFGVNEPVIFGLPVTKNKKAFFPFVVGGTILGMIPIVCMKLGYLNYPILDAPYIGLGLEGLLVTFDWRAVSINLLQIGLSILFWWPYYRKEVQHEI